MFAVGAFNVTSYGNPAVVMTLDKHQVGLTILSGTWRRGTFLGEKSRVNFACTINNKA